MMWTGGPPSSGFWAPSSEARVEVGARRRRAEDAIRVLEEEPVAEVAAAREARDRDLLLGAEVLVEEVEDRQQPRHVEGGSLAVPLVDDRLVVGGELLGVDRVRARHRVRRDDDERSLAPLTRELVRRSP